MFTKRDEVRGIKISKVDSIIKTELALAFEEYQTALKTYRDCVDLAYKEYANANNILCNCLKRIAQNSRICAEANYDIADHLEEEARIQDAISRVQDIPVDLIDVLSG